MTTQPLLTDLFSLEELQAEIDAGFVNRRLHPSAPLAVLNYSSSAQYAHHWGPVVRQTRGLIYNTETLEIVARPWEKFFNMGQAETPTPDPDEPMFRSTKFDGSLGVLFFDPAANDFAIATRGSFISEQAVHATKWLRAELARQREEMPYVWAFNVGEFSNPFRTYLFEIIYESNRIVVDYGDRDELVLLDVLDNVTGKADFEKFDGLVWRSKAAKEFVPGGFSDNLFSEIPEGSEGFVLYWPGSGIRAKIKADRYIELHKLVFGLSEKSVWSAVADGKTIDEVKDGLPDEFFGFVDDTYSKLRSQQLKRLDEIHTAWEEISGGGVVPLMLTRKEFAQKALKYKDRSKFLFRILDGASEKDILEMIWQELKPVGDTHAKGQSEDVA